MASRSFPPRKQEISGALLEMTRFLNLNDLCGVQGVPYDVLAGMRTFPLPDVLEDLRSPAT